MGSSATQPGPRRGPWEVRANDTVYLAETDGTVHCFRFDTSGDVDGFTDSSNPPTTRRQANFASVTSHNYGFTMDVIKGDYWEVTGVTTVFWIPWIP